MRLMSSLLFWGMVFLFSFSAAETALQDDSSSTSLMRQRRQIGSALRHAMRMMKQRVNNLGETMDRVLIPGVQFAAEKIRDDVAPSIANKILHATNNVVLSTAEGLQKSAQFLSDEVAPVIEDTMVEISNAAMPVVNKGIDAMGTGIRASVNVVSKTTSDGIEQLGQRVLGEQRHNRIKKIANNLSVNFNNSINSLAGAIKKVTVEDDLTPNRYNIYKNRDSNQPTNLPINAYYDQRFYNPQFYQPHLHAPYDRYQSKYHHYYNGYSDIPDKNAKNMSIPQALGKIVSNTAYSLSKQILGPNLTEAVAPIARSVSSVIGQSIPSVSSGNSVRDAEEPEKLRTCTTPHGKRGYCQDLSDCPDLVLELSTLRRSLCFKRLFSPGVCCPDVGQLKKIRDANRKKKEKLAQAQAQAQAQALAQAQAQAQAIAQAQALQNQLLLAQQSQGQSFLPQFGAAVQGLNPQQQLLAQQQQALLQQQGLLQQGQLQPNVLQTGFQTPVNQVPVHPVKNQDSPSPHSIGPSFSSQRISADNVILNTHARNSDFECGVPQIPSARVVGGEESRIGEWPWTVAIYLHGPKKTEFWCGGSLISEDFVLTAAHCTKDSNEKTFNPDQFTVHLGDYQIFHSEDDKVSKPEVFGVRYINPHPDFKRQGYFNDIALIKLSRPVKFSEYILPVCLPPEMLENSQLDSLVGQTPTVIGYGSTTYDGPQSNILRDVKLPIWRNSDCDKAYFQPITDIFLCAGYAQGGKDACQGDSGGPMQLYFNRRWVQLGIVSFGNRCAEPGYPGVYTRITRFLPWIRSNLR